MVRQLRAVVLLSLLVGLVGCGGGSGSASADKVKASFDAWVHDLQRWDVAAACRDITPAFWTAFAGDVNGRLAGTGQSVSTSDCLAGLRSLFELAGRAPVVRSGVRATDVVVHGFTAAAREAGAGPQTIPMRFVEQAGRWRLDCCVGHQRELQAQTSYRIPSASMMPTLHVGQIVVSDNAALRTAPPALGAIVVFHPPAGADAMGPKCGVSHQGAGFPRVCGAPTAQESTQTFIKRVVGLPGDRIALVNGTVIRNGRPEPRAYRVVPCHHEPDCNFPRPITVPAGEYFVLGDNLPASDDSRFWGPVKRSWLIGLVRVG